MSTQLVTDLQKLADGLKTFYQHYKDHGLAPSGPGEPELAKDGRTLQELTEIYQSRGAWLLADSLKGYNNTELADSLHNALQAAQDATANPPRARQDWYAAIRGAVTQINSILQILETPQAGGGTPDTQATGTGGEQDGIADKGPIKSGWLTIGQLMDKSKNAAKDWHAKYKDMPVYFDLAGTPYVYKHEFLNWYENNSQKKPSGK